MEIGKINIKDINIAEYNPRLISNDEFEKLGKSIETFGLVDPIIINLKNNKIIGGHQRYDVLFEKYENGEDLEELNILKLGNIGWVFVDEEIDIVDENHEKALNLALNKITGEWDEPKLDSLLDELAMSGFDIDLTGFEGMDLFEFKDTSVENEENVEDDVVESDATYVLNFNSEEDYDAYIELLKKMNGDSVADKLMKMIEDVPDDYTGTPIDEVIVFENEEDRNEFKSFVELLNRNFNKYGFVKFIREKLDGL